MTKESSLRRLILTKIEDEMMKKTYVISISNQKGGVGKSSITFNLSKELANKGHKVLIIDNDPQSNLTSVFFDNPEDVTANILDIYKHDDYLIQPQNVAPNLDLIGSDIRVSTVVQKDIEVIYRLKESLEKIKDNYHFILIDCLPSFGQLMTAAFNASDYILIPVKLSPFDIYGLNDLFTTISNIKKRVNSKLDVLGIILNMVDGRSTSLAEKLEKSIRESYEDLVFKSKIPKGVKFEESHLFNQSIIEYAPSTKIADDFKAFVREFLKRLKGKENEQ